MPWAEVPTGRFICDAFRDGEPLEAMPRRVYARALERCRAAGYEPLFGFEPEFYLLDGQTKGRLFEGVHIFNTVRNTYVPFLQTLVDELRAIGIDVITHNSEYSGSQYEIPFSPGKGMDGPDACFTFKNSVKELAHLHGYCATFMGKPFSGLAGSGSHTHVSLLDAEGRSVFGDDAAEHGISDVCRAFIAGQLAYARAIYTLLVPTVNCLKRRRVHTFSPTTVSWGPEDRSALVRIKGGSEASRHVEQRAPTSLANPYLVAAGILAAGVLGIEQQLELESPASAAGRGADRPRAAAGRHARGARRARGERADPRGSRRGLRHRVHDHAPLRAAALRGPRHRLGIRRIRGTVLTGT